MSARRITFACALTLAASVPAVALAASPEATPAPTPAVPGATIKPGVTAGGVDLSGLTVTAATARLHGALDAHLARPVAFDVGGRVFRQTPQQAQFRFDAVQTARNALQAPGTPSGAPAAGGATSATASDVPLVVRHSTTAVRGFVSKVAAGSRRQERSATLKITVKHMVVKRSKYGYRVDQIAAAKLVNAAWSDAAASRKLHTRLVKVRPKTNTNDLARQYGTVLTVDKSERKLRVFKNLKISKRYSVAIGQPAYPTPEGLFHVQSKQVNPVWSVPNSPWAGELAGTTVTGGSAANPLKARWIGIVDGVGFHGTGDDASIGQAASHGCLRMHVSDVIDLYPRVPVGAPVLIAA